MIDYIGRAIQYGIDDKRMDRIEDQLGRIEERLERIEKANRPEPILSLLSEEDAARMSRVIDEYKAKRCPLDGSPIPEEGE